MEIKIITIHVEIPRRFKRAAAFVGVPVLVLGVGAMATAGMPEMFSDGEVLSAEKMNRNFAGLSDRLEKVEVQAGGWFAQHAAAVAGCAAIVEKPPGAVDAGTPNFDAGTIGSAIAKTKGAHCTEICANALPAGKCYGTLGFAAVYERVSVESPEVGSYFLWSCGSQNGGTEIDSTAPGEADILAYCCCWY